MQIRKLIPRFLNLPTSFSFSDFVQYLNSGKNDVYCFSFNPIDVDESEDNQGVKWSMLKDITGFSNIVFLNYRGVNHESSRTVLAFQLLMDTNSRIYIQYFTRGEQDEKMLVENDGAISSIKCFGIRHTRLMVTSGNGNCQVYLRDLENFLTVLDNKDTLNINEYHRVNLIYNLSVNQSDNASSIYKEVKDFFEDFTSLAVNSFKNGSSDIALYTDESGLHDIPVKQYHNYLLADNAFKEILSNSDAFYLFDVLSLLKHVASSFNKIQWLIDYDKNNNEKPWILRDRDRTFHFTSLSQLITRIVIESGRLIYKMPSGEIKMMKSTRYHDKTNESNIIDGVRDWAVEQFTNRLYRKYDTMPTRFKHDLFGFEVDNDNFCYSLKIKHPRIKSLSIHLDELVANLTSITIGVSPNVQSSITFSNDGFESVITSIEKVIECYTEVFKDSYNEACRDEFYFQHKALLIRTHEHLLNHVNDLSELRIEEKERVNSINGEKRRHIVIGLGTVDDIARLATRSNGNHLKDVSCFSMMDKTSTEALSGSYAEYKYIRKIAELLNILTSKGDLANSVEVIGKASIEPKSFMKWNTTHEPCMYRNDMKYCYHTWLTEIKSTSDKLDEDLLVVAHACIVKSGYYNTSLTSSNELDLAADFTWSLVVQVSKKDEPLDIFLDFTHMVKLQPHDDILAVFREKIDKVLTCIPDLII